MNASYSHAVISCFHHPVFKRILKKEKKNPYIGKIQKKKKKIMPALGGFYLCKKGLMQILGDGNAFLSKCSSKKSYDFLLTSGSILMHCI